MRTVPGTFTAQAFIITDLDDNQITAFHPGAMNRSQLNDVGDVAGNRAGHRRSRRQAKGCNRTSRGFAAAGIPFIFDPGQGMPLFTGDELAAMIDAADYVAVNDYEGRLLCRAHRPCAAATSPRA